MRQYIILIMLGLLFFGCVNPPQGNQTNNTMPVITTPNGTAQGNATLPASTNGSVDIGDNVSVIYALYVDGNLIDTNNATLANESGMYNPNRKYEPFNFTAEFNKGVIDGFVIGVVGMHKNETISFKVDPKRGYGEYDPQKVFSVQRFYNKSVFETVPRSYFTERSINVSNGTSFNSPYGMVSVNDFNDENVTLFYVSLTQLNSSFKYNNIPQQVVHYSNFSATLELLLDVNTTYTIPDPQTGAPTRFKILDKTDENITLDGNNPLADKTLDFTVTMLDFAPAKK